MSRSRCSGGIPVFFSMISWISSGFIFPVPTSTIVPTIARTIFRKTIGRNGQNQFFPMLFPYRFLNFAEISFVIGMQFCKTCKIFILKQNFTGFIHRIYIQSFSPKLPCRIFCKRILFQRNIIFISPV